MSNQGAILAELTKTEHIVYRRQSFEKGCLGCVSRKYDKFKFKMECSKGVAGHPDHTKFTCILYKRKY